MSDFKENIEKLNIRGIIMSSVMTAFGLVVALSWKDAINELVNSIIPNSDNRSMLGMFITALAVTLLVSALATFALKFNKRLEQQLDRVNDLFDRDLRLFYYVENTRGDFSSTLQTLILRILFRLLWEADL